MRVDTMDNTSSKSLPTDSRLPNDGARVTTWRFAEEIRNRVRCVTERVITIAQALGHKEQERRRETERILTAAPGRQMPNDT
jgi:hypothetical protein